MTSLGPRRPWVLLAAAFVALLLARGSAGAPPKKELPPPPAPDATFYAANVAPWIEEHCAGCHRAEGAGAFQLAPVLEPPVEGQDEAARRLLDFRRVLPFVNRDSPWESRLLRKVLDPACGGDPHVGGAFLRDDGEETVTPYDVLLDFCSGATPTNLPPEVYLGKDIRAKPGDLLTVDGSDSFDRDRRDLLLFHWDLAASPPGSRVALSDVRASRVEFVPDVGGTYLLRLRVSDGKVWSAARTVAVEVFQHTTLEARAPGGSSGLEQAETQSLTRTRRLYLDVLGRAPTPTEALEDALQPTQDLVPTILLRAEAGRVWWEEATLRMGLVEDLRPVSQEALDLPLTLVAEHLVPYAAEAVLLRDPSFAKAHPPGRAFAEALARVLLDRAPTAEELLAAEALAAGKPAEAPGLGPVASGGEWLERLLATEGYQRAAILRRLLRFLPRGAAEKQVGGGLLAARAGGQAWRAFLEQRLLSDDYLKRQRLERKDDLTLLRGLFVDLLERKPTDRELLSLVRALRVVPGAHAPFAAVVKTLIDSGQVPIPLLVDITNAPVWITDRYLRYVGRRPAPEELTTCGEVLLDAQGGPELVIFALLTGPEYACR